MVLLMKILMSVLKFMTYIITSITAGPMGLCDTSDDEGTNYARNKNKSQRMYWKRSRR
jgi:hypothetical protein